MLAWKIIFLMFLIFLNIKIWHLNIIRIFLTSQKDVKVSRNINIIDLLDFGSIKIIFALKNFLWIWKFADFLFFPLTIDWHLTTWLCDVIFTTRITLRWRLPVKQNNFACVWYYLPEFFTYFYYLKQKMKKSATKFFDLQYEQSIKFYLPSKQKERESYLQIFPMSICGNDQIQIILKEK